MSTFTAPIAEEIWNKKYRFVRATGEEVDLTVQDTWHRIADALAEAEEPEKRSEYASKFYYALSDFKFLPAGRIISGAGTARQVTLFNCFVMGTVPDSMSGIFDMLKEAALTMQQGGGIGYDFSTLRPKGSLVKGVDSDASGPLSFMDCWDAMCRTIMSAGSRRGAMMATMRCDHPDVEDFITAKQDAAKLRMFNMSVLVTDDFMEAVKTDSDWDLKFKDKIYKTVKARDLWNTIMQSTYDYAEPGVIFIDRINKTNNLNYCETIAATNPCGEQPLPPYGACLLGSINLTRFVSNPFTSTAMIDQDALTEVVSLAVRMMDNVVDTSNFPLAQQQAEALAKRRIGLGITGLADMLVMLGFTYGTDQAVYLTETVMQTIARAAYLASVELAKEKGAFLLFDADEYLADGTYASTLDEDVKDAIREHGIRNSHLTSVAPTGTISLYAGNVSSGGEPIFAHSYTRKILEKDGTRSEQLVKDYAYNKFDELFPGKDVPDTFVTAQTLTPEAHIKMQAAMQKHVDSSISKTVNLPADISFEDFKEVYWQAYELGCKGCTTYRPNDVTGSVLSVDEAPAAAPQEPSVDLTVTEELVSRPEALAGHTYKIKWPGSDHALYVTISDYVENGVTRPFEVFINSKNMEHYSWTVALTRMISAVFRRAGDVSFVVEELKSVFDPRGGVWMKGTYVPSILAAIGGVIEQHLIEIGYIPGSASIVEAVEDQTEPAEEAPKQFCPSCFGTNFVKEGGCEVCKDCGNSACG